MKPSECVVWSLKRLRAVKVAACRPQSATVGVQLRVVLVGLAATVGRAGPKLAAAGSPVALTMLTRSLGSRAEACSATLKGVPGVFWKMLPLLGVGGTSKTGRVLTWMVTEVVACAPKSSCPTKLMTLVPSMATVGVHEKVLCTGLPDRGRAGPITAPGGRPMACRFTWSPGSLSRAFTVNVSSCPGCS